MIRLAVRMIRGRESIIRLIVTACGVAIGVTLLLYAAVGFPALHAHDVRAAWTQTTAHNTAPDRDEARADPLLWDARGPEEFEGKEITRVDVAALGPRAPVPPGLARLPGPGELAVSPALERLMARTPRDLLADRFPGRIVETVGDAALTGPDSLVIFVGDDPGPRGRPPYRSRTARSMSFPPSSPAVPICARRTSRAVPTRPRWWGSPTRTRAT
jgi:hypothetical protein